MKKLVCILALVLSFMFTAVMPASAEVIYKEYPWGTNYYTSDILTVEAPAVQCAVDGNCEEISDPCLLDNSCMKLKSCVVYSSAVYYNYSWGMQGGGLHCDDLLFHGITGSGSQGNEEQASEENYTQNGAIFNIEKKERRQRN